MKRRLEKSYQIVPSGIIFQLTFKTNNTFKLTYDKSIKLIPANHLYNQTGFSI